jgi:hypothetical protein
MTPALSVVIPAFNEQDRIGPYFKVQIGDGDE